MKLFPKAIFASIAFTLITVSCILTSCSKDAIRTTTYQLKLKDQLGVSGTVVFTETSSSVTTITISLTGGDTQSHPAQIRFNSAVEGGATAITLSDVVNGTSTTLVSKQDNGTSLNYTQLIAYDGYVNIQESALNFITTVAVADIGGNALTTTNKSYTLATVGTLGVSGTAKFEKRLNGNTLVSVLLIGTIAGGIHPTGIYLGSVTTVGGGPLVKTLNNVNGATGEGYSNIKALDDGTAITYDNLLMYDGYLSVSQSPANQGSILCQGNIGTH